MAQRSRRLRKKLRIDEFREVGFEVSWHFPLDSTEAAIDQLVDRLIAEVIEPRGLAFAGAGHLGWEGLVCTRHIGCCTQDDIEACCGWLKAQGMEAIHHSPLFDVWYGDPV